MIRRSVFLGACLVVGVLAAPACKRKTEGAEKPGTAVLTSSALRESIEDASRRVSFARCEKEMACSGLTRWTRDTNEAECIDRVKVETMKEVNVQACPRGIDHERLVDCVAAIERMGCDDPVGRLMELEDCRQRRLCVSAPAR